MQLYFLGPRGSFTHQAARVFAHELSAENQGDLSCELVPCTNEGDVFSAVEDGFGYGVLAWENNVEGYVAQNLDTLIDAHDVIGIARTSIDVVFDAFIRADHGELTQACAHPHGLAQCLNFIQSHGLQLTPAQSNAAACENLQAHQVSFAPRGCGEIYGLETLAQSVQDYSGAHTDFLLLAPRSSNAVKQKFIENAQRAGRNYESVITVIPLSTGPGVIANLMDVFRDNGLNMTSLISRPIKAVDGTYSFIITVDAAPWDEAMCDVMSEIENHGDWLKVLAVYPQRQIERIPVSRWNLPHKGVNPVLDDIVMSRGEL